MKKILVAVDGSPRERGVLSTAADMARRTGARLVVLRAVKLSNELPPEAYLMPEGEIAKVLERRAKVALDQAVLALPPEIVERTRAEIAEPWKAICSAAKDEDVDLIVIGAHGYGTLERVLGTTAARVVDHADRSVLVVRGEDAPKAVA
jgi:nucleotide-binding universal stress UspA family protein